MTVDLFESAIECGCAAKVPADLLALNLAKMPCFADPNVIVGPQSFDDAAVYRLSPEHYLVQTVDFFPPVARTPSDYGKIAAANALSDIYAMGGKPLCALCCAGIPAHMAASELLRELIAGACKVLEQAHCCLVGGHSVIDTQIKFGFSVTGIVDPENMLTNATAMPGDWLILTKPLGIGTTVMASRANIATKQQEQHVNEVMTLLNRNASHLALVLGAKCATDITGFGLAGHALQMAQSSGVSLEIYFENIELLPGAKQFAEQGLLSAATYTNRQYVANKIVADTTLCTAEQDLLFDPQTSGGLLFCCPDKSFAMLQQQAQKANCSCWVIGKVVQASEQAVIFVRKRQDEN